MSTKDENKEIPSAEDQQGLINRLRRESNWWWSYGLLIGFLMGMTFGMYYMHLAQSNIK